MTPRRATLRSSLLIGGRACPRTRARIAMDERLRLCYMPLKLGSRMRPRCQVWSTRRWQDRLHRCASSSGSGPVHKPVRSLEYGATGSCTRDRPGPVPRWSARVPRQAPLWQCHVRGLHRRDLRGRRPRHGPCVRIVPRSARGAGGAQRAALRRRQAADRRAPPAPLRPAGLAAAAAGHGVADAGVHRVRSRRGAGRSAGRRRARGARSAPS